ncbi:glycoside hydrolase family 88 protein [Paenibacillus sp. BSR1-1]|uniref:glycoside hydrolase family 88 protein n=1 Tax=Paenibacillus sp. BSR1-1 TaxID=3020845 RepID=UPI0025AFC66B|nr:glycoside hydrolase family 88 protein [Paenibacillus sp. BSR1-1]MDN3018458.1 glycoside hydrolase family 88 protein [Paenibacillus sp. BSR1-1]
MWKLAIEDAVEKTRNNIDRFGELFPHISMNGRYQLNENNDWTDGFWSGLLWLCYEYSNEPIFKGKALKTVKSFENRLKKHIVLDHHDIGFLYSLSTKAQWMIEKNESARALTLRAADKLLLRWHEKGQYLQAWGAKNDEKESGRIIIDCLLNLPLLYWASKQTGDPKYRDVALAQAEKSRRYLVRGDDSSYHTFFFNQETGEPIGGATHQGYTNGSTWTRGQAWGIYGFALSYHYTKNSAYLETAKRMAKYFIEHLPEDYVSYWDFNAPVDETTPRDSSATAIAACGLLEINKHLNEDDSDRSYFEDTVIKMMKSLVVNYSTIKEKDAEGLLNHGSYHVLGNLAIDDYMVWGDYYYLEALMRLEKNHEGFWYE